jgi:hypothetical protein
VKSDQLQELQEKGQVEVVKKEDGKLLKPITAERGR